MTHTRAVVDFRNRQDRFLDKRSGPIVGVGGILGEGDTGMRIVDPPEAQPPGGGGPIVGGPQSPSPTPRASPAPNPQQQGFDNCARQAWRQYRRTYLRTSGQAVLGGFGIGLGISVGMGIRGLGLGVRGAAHAAGDLALPVVGRLLTAAVELQDSAIIATGLSVIGGGLARDALKKADQNSKRLEGALKDCESRYPAANHSRSFLNF